MIWGGNFGSHNISSTFRWAGLRDEPRGWSTMPKWWNPSKAWTPGLVWASLVGITQYLFSYSDARKVMLTLTPLWEDNLTLRLKFGKIAQRNFSGKSTCKFYCAGKNCKVNSLSLVSICIPLVFSFLLPVIQLRGLCMHVAHGTLHARPVTTASFHIMKIILIYIQSVL